MNKSEIKKPIVQVKNLSKGFVKRPIISLFSKNKKIKPVLQKITFDVFENETFGIIGPNGSGKSTLIRILSTLLLPDKGNVKIFNYDIIRDSSKIKDLINRVSVEAAFYKALSAKENLIYSSLLYGEDPKITELKGASILEKLGLKLEAFDERLEYMSRGTQQKVAITRALLSSPKLILLDEPTTGLDPKSKKIVQNFILDLKKEYRATIILTSHDMQEIERLCDRVAFIDNGQFVVQGTIEELKHKIESEDLEEVFMKLSGYDEEVF